MPMDRLSQPIPWGSAKYPPPTKPLPPIPHVDCPKPSEPYSGRFLLLHPVPSPSLRIDMMALHHEDSCESSSPESSTFSSVLRRDSMSSIAADSLLPPTPLSIRPLTPANSVECRLQEISSKCSEVTAGSTISRRNATPDQLDKLCAELESLSTRQYYSTFPAGARTKRPTIRKVNTDCDWRTIRPPKPSPSSSYRFSNFEVGIQGASDLQQCFSSKAPASQQGQTSFIDWDDGSTRLAKMKRSIADLKAGNRTRSSSAPLAVSEPTLTTSEAPSPSGEKGSTQIADPSLGAIHQGGLHVDANTPIRDPTKVAKKKSLQRRKTVLVIDSGPSRSKHDDRRVASSSTTSTMASMRRKHNSTVSSGPGSRRRAGLQKISGWVKKVMKLS